MSEGRAGPPWRPGLPAEPGDLLYRMPEEAEAADRRVRPFVRETPLEHAPEWSTAWGSEVYLKLENQQATGSFKYRGAVNKLLTMPMSQRALGVVAASTGNHGAAVAAAARGFGIPAVVFVPEGTSAAKLRAIRRAGAELRTHGHDGVEAEREARRFADQSGRVYVSPYNDAQVVTGQATVGVELARQLDRIDGLFVAVGGGGLVSGAAGVLRGIGREVVVVGCSPARSAVMHASVHAGHIVELPLEPTLSDGTAGGIEADAITFPLCRALIDDWVLVDEPEIADLMRLTLDATGHLVEGSAAVALAGARRLASRFPRGNIVIVICGGNVGLDTLRSVVCKSQ